MDLIKATQPIIIVDEQQSVDGGLSGGSKAALDAMNPFCTLRYSATHVDKHHMVYRLAAVDAYEQKRGDQLLIDIGDPFVLDEIPLAVRAVEHELERDGRA